MRTVSRSGVPMAGRDTPTTAELFSMVLISPKVIFWSPTVAITSSVSGSTVAAAVDAAALSFSPPACCGWFLAAGTLHTAKNQYKRNQQGFTQ